MVLDWNEVDPVITKTECQHRALMLRVEAFDFMDRRNALLILFDVQLDEYPAWVRNFDKQIGDRLAEADRLIRLAQGPFWKRWSA